MKFLLAPAVLSLAFTGAPSIAQNTPKKPEVPVTNSGMNGEILYEILVGELNVQQGQPLVGFSLLLDAARKTNDAQLFARSVEIALKERSGDGALMAAIEKVCAEQAETAEKVRNGHLPAAGALIGAVMKETKGQADAAKVRSLLLTHLGQSEG